MSNGVERSFFVHVQKAGGTSVNFMLRRQFRRAAIYPDDTDGDAISRVILVDHLMERWNARREQIRVVTGHFPLCTADVLGGVFTTFTLLREPVARTLSYLRHHRASLPNGSTVPLQAIYDDEFRFHGLIHNHMVKMFSLTPEEMTHGALTRVKFTPDRLERAKENLQRVDVVGVQEQFDVFCADLASCFGWRLGEPVHVNRTEPDELSDALVARIAEDNALDAELYDFALKLVAEGSR